MLVCSVSARPQRILAAIVAEAGAAADVVGMSGLGQLISEAASAADTLSATVSGPPAIIAADISETATAASAQDGTTGGVPTTFDPGTLTNTTLSNGNKTVTLSSASMGGARSSLYKSSGKWYFEITIGATSTSGDGAGVLISVSPYSEVVVTGTSCTVAYLSSGNIYSNGSYTSKTLGAIVAGNVVSVAVDITNARGWIRKNGGNWNADPTADPATGVGGVVMNAPWSWSPVVAFGSSGAANNMTGNFGASAYAYTPPTGFNNWAA